MKTSLTSITKFAYAGAIVSAVALVGTRVLADDASDIDQYSYPAELINYDNTAGDDPNGYPIISAVASAPGTVSGHLYTGWALLTQDETGSEDVFVSTTTLAGLASATPSNESATPPYGTEANASTVFQVGMAINVQGQWSPFHCLSEIGFSTVVASNNYVAVTSSGNATSGPPVYVISNVNYVAAISNAVWNPGNVSHGGGLNPALAGMYIELQNVTISGSTGSFQTTFPTYALANTVNESYTITDSTGSMEFFDYVTSYSTAAALGGTAVPTGPVTIDGFLSVFPSASLPGGGLPEFTVVEIVPEPSTLVLAGMGILGLLAIRRRRS